MYYILYSYNKGSYGKESFLKKTVREDVFTVLYVLTEDICIEGDLHNSNPGCPRVNYTSNTKEKSPEHMAKVCVLCVDSLEDRPRKTKSREAFLLYAVVSLT